MYEANFDLSFVEDVLSDLHAVEKFVKQLPFWITKIWEKIASVWENLKAPGGSS